MIIMMIGPAPSNAPRTKLSAPLASATRDAKPAMLKLSLVASSPLAVVSCKTDFGYTSEMVAQVFHLDQRVDLAARFAAVVDVGDRLR